MAFSVHALRSIEAFAASMELTAQPARDGSFTFVFERSGSLSLTSSDDGAETLVSLARQPTRSDPAIERRALAVAGLDPTTNRFLHAGLARDGSIVFAQAIADTAFDLPALEACLQRLIAAHDAIV